MNQKKTLIEKYNIPLYHLDFKYIEECENAREMEKIVQILRSGEEGFYPDLTKCAEEKLRLLKPHSRYFRVEEPVLSRDALSPSEWNPFYEWTHTIKTKDNKLDSVSKLVSDCSANEDLPPIRKGGTITSNKQDANNNNDQSALQTSTKKKTECIKSTDYSKWDKYDPDVEVLKMELAEERESEAVERKNRLNLQKSAPIPKIEDIADQTEDERWKKLSDIEREKFAIDFRLRGNEYFRAKEYEHALLAYTKAINMWPVSAVDSYNNRAVTFIKLGKYEEAVADCQSCLKLEPNNIKAWIRKAEAVNSSGKKNESYPLYQKVLELDPENKIALKAVKELDIIYGERPPANATRMRIEETQSTTNTTINIKEKTGLSNADASKNKNIKKKTPEYDFVELVKPNIIINNNIESIAQKPKTDASESLLFETSTERKSKLLIEELN